MRKITGAALSAPQALASHGSSVQLKNALQSSVWLVSHHRPLGGAAYNREGDMGQQGGFDKGVLSGSLDPWPHRFGIFRDERERLLAELMIAMPNLYHPYPGQ